MKKRRTQAPKGGSKKVRKKSIKSRGSVVGLVLLALSAMLLFAVLFFVYVAPVLFDSSPAEKRVTEKSYDKGPGTAEQEDEPDLPDMPDRFKATAPSVRIAIVIDDFGYDIKRLRRLFELDAEIAVAVLPHQRYSRSSAEEAHERGWQVLLHLPMEPVNSAVNNPGEGALLTSMSSAELVSVIDKDLGNVPYVAGVNNHMGSKATADADLMATVLDVMVKRQLFFLDSRTTAKSVAPELMESLGVRGGSRNIFLDNTRDRDYIRAQVKELVRLARLNGSAIAIGHPYTETIDVLLETVPGLIDGGVEVVRLSDLMEVSR